MTTMLSRGTFVFALALVACGPATGSDIDSGHLEDASQPGDGGAPVDANGMNGDAGHSTSDGGATNDASTPACTDGARRCGSGGDVEECAGGSFGHVADCPIGCADGECTDTASCTPGARRCAGDVSEICNATGTAYLFGDGCESADACVDGLCTGACTPGALRCNAGSAERCADDGTGYVVSEACDVACVAGHCALERLDVTSDTDLNGDIFVDGPVNVFPGATLRSSSGDLTIHAQSITVDESGSIEVAPTGTSPGGQGGMGDTCYGGGITSHGGGGGGGYGTGGSWGAVQGYTCGAFPGYEWGSTTDTDVQPGSAGGDSDYSTNPGGHGGGVLRLIADQITISGTVRADGEAGQGSYTSASGSGSGGGILIAADQLTIAGAVSAIGGNSGMTGGGGDGRVKILHGASASITGTLSGAVTQSLLPPLTITSTTHPDPTLYYADDFAQAVISWNAPFASRQGYYVLVDTMPSHVPTPADADFVMAYALAIDRASFVDGDNYVHVVPIDAMSAVGAVESTFRIRVETSPPALSSSSHPSETTWSTNPNVIFEWTMPQGDASYRGVRYVLDHYGDTVPADTDTFLPISQHQLLRAGLADGIWAFHAVAVDTRGRLTRLAGHRQVRLGADPGAGTVLGNVSGPSGAVAGATISINRGLFPTQATNSGGDFDLTAISAGTWELSVSADGYQPFTQTITVTADGTTNVPVVLTPL